MEGKIPIIRFCKVISVDDDTDADRIKVKLSPEDNSKKIEEIDYVFPLLPKTFHVKPKVGEAVLVILATANDGNSQRYYIGPVISQDHRIYNDPYFKGADSFLRGAFKKLDVAPRMDANKNGILPKDDDIVIRGRKNADIQIAEDDIRIKAGVKVTNEDDYYQMTFNIKNPAYAKIKYHTKPLVDGSKSTATVVAEKISLLSTSSPVGFNLTDRESLISDEELNKVIEEAYKIPYGEKLVDLLNIFINAFMHHTHDYSMLPPNESFLAPLRTQKANLLDNKQLLSNTVRIN